MNAHTPQSPNSIEAIAARHEQDDHWFKGGLHDGNGYVAMAHKDRGELLRLARAGDVTRRMIDADSKGTVMVIPSAAYRWLMDEGPDDEGGWFPLFPTIEGIRSTFRRMCGL